MSLLSLTASDVFISKGYGEKPAIQFYEGEKSSMRFRISAKRYDPSADNNTRWLNMTVKGFGEVCEQAKSMKLKEGSCITIIGELMEDHWHDTQRDEDCSEIVLNAKLIRYGGNGGGKKDSNAANGQSQQSQAPQGQQTPPPQGQQSQGYAQQPPQGQQAQSYQQPPQGYQQPHQGQPPAQSDHQQQQMPSGFTGYEQFGGQNPFYPTNNQQG